MIIINKLKLKRKRVLLLRKMTCPSKDITIGRSSCIVLKDGSTATDIKIGSKVLLYGVLFSQSGGRICIGNNVRIGPNSMIMAVENIMIGDYTLMAQNIKIVDNNNHAVNPNFRLYMRQMPETDEANLWKYSTHAPIIIGKNVWIGENVRIHKGVTVGDNSIIGANSVVTKNVPANCIAAGNPARVVKTNIEEIPAPTNCTGYNEFFCSLND